MAYLYRHIRLDKNEPFYIGIGSDKYYRRASETTRRNKYWTSIVSNTDYEVEILLDNLSWEDACQKEIEFIKLYGRKNNNTGYLCNMTDGGEGTIGLVMPEEAKKTLSKLKAGNKNCLGKFHSEETKLKMSMSHKNISEETRVKMKKSQTGKKLSEETKRKIGDARRGVKHTEESRRKMSETIRKNNESKYLRNF